MDVKIDVSENVRKKDKDSFLAVATEDGSYKRNIGLLSRVKNNINHFSDRIDEIHCIMIYLLIKDDLSKYDTIQIDTDISKNSITNNLRKLFKQDQNWKNIELDGRKRISPVKKCFVDKYVKRVREGKEERGYILTAKDLNHYLLIFNDK